MRLGVASALSITNLYKSSLSYTKVSTDTQTLPLRDGPHHGSLNWKGGGWRWQAKDKGEPQ
jgi:hypothetical protein